MFCRNCGEQIPDGAKLCSKCGAEIMNYSVSGGKGFWVLEKKERN